MSHRWQKSPDGSSNVDSYTSDKPAYIHTCIQRHVSYPTNASQVSACLICVGPSAKYLIGCLNVTLEMS